MNEVGMQQVQMVGESLKGVRFDRAFSSDLSRATKTAETILAHHPEVRLERRIELRERVSLVCMCVYD